MPNKSFRSIQDEISNCVAQNSKEFGASEVNSIKNTSFTVCRVLNVLSREIKSVLVAFTSSNFYFL